MNPDDEDLGEPDGYLVFEDGYEMPYWMPEKEGEESCED